LRGLNIGGDSKVPPFRAIDKPEQLDVLPRWGANSARLLFNWEAFEAERGHYDNAYLEYYAGLLDALHARGLYVIVDIHQDAFSRYATGGCGDGMPRWALGDCVTAVDPDNGPACANWGLQSLLNASTRRCFSDFYADKNGVLSSFLAMLQTVAQRFHEHPALLGYDMLNEPGGDEANELAPFYEAAGRVVRAADPDAILFISPGVLSSAGLGTSLPRPSFDNIVYSPHYYDATIAAFGSWSGNDPAGAIDNMLAKARQWNVPLFIGEFGAPAHAAHADAYIDAFYAALDARSVSAAQWNFTPHWNQATKDGWNDEDFSVVDDAGALRSTFRIRPYPRRTAGSVRAFTVSRASTALDVRLSWDHDPQRGETTLFVPQALFAQAPTITASAGVGCEYAADATLLQCLADAPGLKQVSITGEPAP
jgi:endoglycosylceramidase